MPMTRREALGAAAAAGLLGAVGPTPGAHAAPLGRTSDTSKGTEMTVAESYIAVALQLAAHAVNKAPSRTEARAQMMKRIEEIRANIHGSRLFLAGYTGTAVRLYVLPEYFLTSYPLGETIPGWADKAALDIGGPEYEAIGRIAQDEKVFIAGNAYETDPHFPGFYFQTSFIVSDAGDVVVRYRRLNSMFAPTPHDVWQKYLDIYGLDGVFPVARTEIGNLAAIASEEILYPEIARCHALRGAEVFAHCSSEIGSPMATNKNIARQARAFENLAYVVSTNTAGLGGVDLPFASADGNSAVIDYKGNMLAEANTGETFTAAAEIDLHALRRARRKPGMINYLARQRLDVFAGTYAGTVIHPAGTMLDADGKAQVPERSHFMRMQQQIIDRMDKAGII